MEEEKILNQIDSSYSKPASIVPILEQYVNDSITKEDYQIRIYSSLLQIYKTYPKMANEDIVAKILCKTIMDFPNEENYLSCSYLISQKMEDASELIQKVLEIGVLLQTSNFGGFWEKKIELFDSINGFYNKIREYIFNSLKFTYQIIPLQLFSKFMNISDSAQLNDFIIKENIKQIEEDSQKFLQFEVTEFNRALDKNVQGTFTFEDALKILYP